MRETKKILIDNKGEKVLDVLKLVILLLIVKYLGRKLVKGDNNGMKRKINHHQIRENHQCLHITLLLTIILILMMFSKNHFLHGKIIGFWIQKPLAI